jgi:hypothetical protein
MDILDQITDKHSYSETLCMIASDCATILNCMTNDKSKKLNDLHVQHGSIGIYSEYIQWAVEFEILHKDNEWIETEWIDTLELFIENKIKSL